MLRNPRAFGVGGSRPQLRYSYRHSHSRPLHRRSPDDFAADRDAPLPGHPPCGRPRGFGTRLEPRWILGAGAHRPVSYYALFQGWLLLSQPPGCPRAPTTFPAEPGFRDLSRRSGLFPSRRRIFAPAASLPPSEPGGIRGLSRVGRWDTPAPKQSPTSARSRRGCTSMHFGENQLSPGSLGISPLPTAHPSILQHTPVRASTASYSGFALAMGSSPGFGLAPCDSSPCSDSLSLRLRLPAP